jgi:hypothetical protein
MKTLQLFCVVLLLLFGAGCTSEYAMQHIEGYHLTPGDEVDILMVIDNSCSMQGGASTYAAFAVSESIQELQDAKVNWDLSIVSTDPTDDTWFPVKQGPDSSWDMVFALGNMQQDAGPAEMGFDAALTKNDLHFEWFDSGHTLIFFVSDEREQSTYTSDEFLTYWTTPLVVVSITGPAEESIEATSLWSCSGETAPKYNAASDYHIDICSEEPWSIHDFLTITN